VNLIEEDSHRSVQALGFRSGLGRKKGLKGSLERGLGRDSRRAQRGLSLDLFHASLNPPIT
jgi:hypothetical protein